MTLEINETDFGNSACEPLERGRGEFDMQIANHPCLASFLRSSQWSKNPLQNADKKLFII